MKADDGPKGRIILWNYALEYYFIETKCMESFETVLNYPYLKITFTFHTDEYDNKLGAVIIQNNKPIDLFSRKLINTHRNYTTTGKELLLIFEYLNKSHGIIFGYKNKLSFG